MERIISFLSGMGCPFHAQQGCVDGNEESTLAPPTLLLQTGNSEMGREVFPELMNVNSLTREVFNNATLLGSTVPLTQCWPFLLDIIRLSLLFMYQTF